MTSIVQARWIRSATKDEIKARCTWEPYCEDERLSISCGGELYRALYIPPDTPAISADAREELLTVLCSYYSVAECKPKKKGEMMDAWNWMQSASSSYKQKREREAANDKAARILSRCSW